MQYKDFNCGVLGSKANNNPNKSKPIKSLIGLIKWLINLIKGLLSCLAYTVTSKFFKWDMHLIVLIV